MKSTAGILNERTQDLLESMRGKPLNGLCGACWVISPAVVEGEPATPRWEPGDQTCPVCREIGVLHSVSDPTWESPASRAIRDCLIVQLMDREEVLEK
jgi:hypothetical protein